MAAGIRLIFHVPLSHARCFFFRQPTTLQSSSSVSPPSLPEMHRGSSSNDGLPSFLSLPEFINLPLLNILQDSAGTNREAASAMVAPVTFSQLPEPEALTAPSLPGTPTGWSTLSAEARTLVIIIPIIALTLLCGMIGACLNRIHAAYKGSDSLLPNIAAATAPAGKRPPLISLYTGQPARPGHSSGNVPTTRQQQQQLPGAKASRRSRSRSRSRRYQQQSYDSYPPTPSSTKHNFQRTTRPTINDDTMPLIYFVHAPRPTALRPAAKPTFPPPFYSTPTSSSASLAAAAPCYFFASSPSPPPPPPSRGRSRTRKPRSG
ncbi:hypothetical protein HDU86_002440 [Geranomyces michiganensis]|nr:hypothetical protein HDU86_002440 [Geranomyces michiganensis]